MNKMVRKGELWLVDFGPGRTGCEMRGVRPALIVQNDVGNAHSPVTICAPITTKNKNKWLPTHFHVDRDKYGLCENSVVLMEQIRAIDKQHLIDPLGILSSEEMKEIDRKLMISLGIGGKK